MLKICLPQKTQRTLIALLVVLFVIKLISTVEAPVLDPSEARYAEMARKMVETADWVTPQIDYGVPFWGKPPLSTWGSALGMAVFGVSEFGARFPVLLMTLGMLAMLYQWVRALRNSDTALLSIVLLTCVPIFYFLADAVMTDMFLAATTSICMVAFHRSVTARKNLKFWPYLFFIGVGLGLLTKGPAATVLAALPIFLWVLTGNRWLLIWQRLPWIKGSLLAFAIAAPWYFIAENKTPGFIEYFIVGEHFMRFVVSGWEGDLYGSAHNEPRGTIWIFWLLTAIPWSISTVYLLIRYAVLRKKEEPALMAARNDDGLLSYLICWAFTPMIFFTMASNIIPTYVLTGIPALPFLILEFYQRTRCNKPGFSAATRLSFSLSVAGVLIAFIFVWVGPTYFPKATPKTTERHLVYHFQSIAEAGDELHYLNEDRLYSAKFYNNGKIGEIFKEDELIGLLSNKQRDYIVQKNEIPLPLQLAEKFQLIEEYKKRSLYREINSD